MASNTYAATSSHTKIDPRISWRLAEPLSFISTPKPHFQMSLQQSEIPHRQALVGGGGRRKKEKETIGTKKQKEKMEVLEKGVSWGGGDKGRRRGGGEEEESGPVPLRGLAVNQKALFIAGEEDKDTQREKVKDRRRRLERPGSFQLNKQTSQPATIGVRVPKTWVSFKNFRLEDSSQSIGICKNFEVRSF